MTSRVEKQFRDFLADEGGALDEMRHFVGAAFAPQLDGSLGSLSKVDAFLETLLADPEWAESSLFEEISPDMRKWLAVRLAYYLGSCLKRRYGTDWALCSDRESDYYETPVITVGQITVSPLDIAQARLLGSLEGGLHGLFVDLVTELHEATGKGAVH